MDKVTKALQEKSEWFDKKSNAASKQILHQDPVVLSSDVLNQKKVGINYTTCVAYNFVLMVPVLNYQFGNVCTGTKH